MAILKNPCDKNFRGAIDKLVVVRQYADGRSVLSAFPDMSNIKPTAAQVDQRNRFRNAQLYAKTFLKDPANKAFYKDKCQPGQRPHNLLISELLKGVTPFNQDDTDLS